MSPRAPSRRPGGRHLGLLVGMALAALVLLALWLWRPARTPAPVAAPEAAASPASAAPVKAVVKTPTVDPRRQSVGQGRWAVLNPAEQAILAPLQADWPDLTRDQRLKWFDLAQRFGSLSPDEQHRIQARMAEWARLSPVERGAARLSFQEIRALTAQERLERWEAYQGLDLQERRELAERGQALTQGQLAPRRSEWSPPVPKSSGAANEAVSAQAPVPRSVGATVVQAPLGATTVLVSRLPTSVPGPAAGPKISATSAFVDPATLLPQPRASRTPALPTVETPPGDAEPAPEPPPPGETPPNVGG